ncbi:hypothetical protein [Paenibacillus solani]|uniref:hypothetical protein n=1 Tax=Paenibacillus solani TaxID=1705565 RepID=UPI003D29AA50
MKKTFSITAALALALSLTAVASADPVEGTVAEPVNGAVTDTSGVVTDTSGALPIVTDEPVIKPHDVVLVPTPMIELTKVTYFYNAPNGEKLGALAPQKIDTTDVRYDVVLGGEWVEVYTWLGKAWIYVE